MKQKMNFAQISRTALLLSLIVFAGFAAARAQVPNGTVIPLVCFESKPETFTRTLTNATQAGSTLGAFIDQEVPKGFYTLVFNPGGATEERLFGFLNSTSPVTLFIHYTGGGFPSQAFLYPHSVGETILAITEGEAVFGYNNTNSATLNIPRGVLTNNYFNNGPLVYSAQPFGSLTYGSQPFNFQPGVHADAMRLKTTSGFNFTWFLNGGQASSTGSASQNCGTITYQGRLSDAGAAANGQFDLQFQAFDLESGGAAQSELITLENVQVTNGIFTVLLKFGSTFTNNFKARFLQIGVRPGNAPNIDPFTVLTPRQPLTQVPYAINAQTAQTALDVRLQLTVNTPPSTECDETNERGRMKLDATNKKLWICTATGWKSTVLQ